MAPPRARLAPRLLLLLVGMLGLVSIPPLHEIWLAHREAARQREWEEVIRSAENGSFLAIDAVLGGRDRAAKRRLFAAAVPKTSPDSWPVPDEPGSGWCSCDLAAGMFELEDWERADRLESSPPVYLDLGRFIEQVPREEAEEILVELLLLTDCEQEAIFKALAQLDSKRAIHAALAAWRRRPSLHAARYLARHLASDRRGERESNGPWTNGVVYYWSCVHYGGLRRAADAVVPSASQYWPEELEHPDLRAPLDRRERERVAVALGSGGEAETAALSLLASIEGSAEQVELIDARRRDRWRQGKTDRWCCHEEVMLENIRGLRDPGEAVRGLAKLLDGSDSPGGLARFFEWAVNWAEKDFTAFPIEAALPVFSTLRQRWDSHSSHARPRHRARQEARLANIEAILVARTVARADW